LTGTGNKLQRTTERNNNWIFAESEDFVQSHSLATTTMTTATDLKIIDGKSIAQ
jgi:hypothetical protein